MLARSVVLRLLLALALVLNGAATAMAGLQTQDMARNTVAAKPHAATSSDLPCHHHDAPDKMVAQATAHADAGVGHGISPDCCKAGTCHCACVQYSPAAVTRLSLALPAPVNTPAWHAERVGYADASLTHSLRPPIG